jgi:hypothetical protein
LVGGIPPGARWENEIYRGLSACRALWLFRALPVGVRPRRALFEALAFEIHALYPPSGAIQLPEYSALFQELAGARDGGEQLEPEIFGMSYPVIMSLWWDLLGGSGETPRPALAYLYGILTMGSGIDWKSTGVALTPKANKNAIASAKDCSRQEQFPRRLAAACLLLAVDVRFTQACNQE